MTEFMLCHNDEYKSWDCKGNQRLFSVKYLFGEASIA